MLLQTSFINTSVLDYEMEILVVEYTKRNKDFQLTFDLIGVQRLAKGKIVFRGDVVPWVLVDIEKDEEKDAPPMTERQIINLLKKASNIRIGLRPIEIDKIDWDKIVEAAREDHFDNPIAIIRHNKLEYEFKFEPDLDNVE